MRHQDPLTDFTNGASSTTSSGHQVCALEDLAVRIRDCHANSDQSHRWQVDEVVSDIDGIAGADP